MSLFENVNFCWMIKLRRVPPLLAKIFYGHARSSGGRLTRKSKDRRKGSEFVFVILDIEFVHTFSTGKDEQDRNVIGGSE